MSARNFASPVLVDTPQRILDSAERLVQTGGFNGFSYADVSAELGITKASLHHHFPSKAELGLALIQRYAETFLGALDGIDESGLDAARKLERYAKLYEEVLKNKRLCLCGMLAAEYTTLPQAMQDEIRRFFDMNERWLARVVEEGRRAKLFHSRGSAADVARMLFGTLEGAMLVARPYNDVVRFAWAAREALASLKLTPTVTRPLRRAGARK
jgi:TetR/AcrR family transcriptional regulator, transcriptional repressor for nem operon